MSDKLIGSQNVQSELKTDSREKYLIFELNAEEYGVQLSVVKEVIALTNVTKIPNVPEYFHGLINLRGVIISVIDLRLKLNLSNATFEEKKTSIIIVTIDGFTLGFIVDEIKQVMSLLDSTIEREITLESRVKKDYINGIARTSSETGLLILLDVNKILGIEELKLIKESTEGQC